MKKKILSLTLIMCIALAGCGNTVSQEDYDSAVSELDALKGNYNNAITELDSLKESYEKTTSELEALKEEYNNVAAERDQYKTDYENAIDEIAELENLSTKNSSNNTSTYPEKASNSGSSLSGNAESGAVGSSTPDSYNTGD